MDVAGIGLAVIAEARTLVTSIRSRTENYHTGPEKFKNLQNLVNSLAKHIAEVEKVFQKFPRAIPDEISAVFHDTFTGVRSSLVHSISIMDEFFSKAFAASSGSSVQKMKSVALRTFCATALNNKMNCVEILLSEASNKLLHLAMGLAGALKVQEHQDELARKMENLRVVQTVKDVYRPGANTPALTDTVNLDFDATDETGKPTTPEGMLKHAILSSDSGRSVTAATGVMRCAYGIVGMAGVGKTVALQGLAYDRDIQVRFNDGIHFMTLGQGATMETAIRGIARIMTITGATSLGESVRSSSSLQEAVDYAASWFEVKVCLFLIDDVWPTKTCKIGFLADLRQLLRRSPKSRMAITTRSVAVAEFAGSVVSFGPRDTFGPVSQNYFHVTRYWGRISNSSSRF